MHQREDLPVRKSDNVPVIFTPDVRAQYEPDEIDLRSHLAMLHRRRGLILAIATVIFVLGMLYTLTRRPIYESTAKILVFTQKPGVAPSEGDLPIIRNLEAITASRSIDTQIEIISSPDLLKNAFARLDPVARDLGFKTDEIPDWSYRIAQAKDADVIAVTGRAYTPGAAAALARAIANEYFAQDLKQSNQAVRQAREFAEVKMASAERQLSEANLALSKFKRESGLFAPDVQIMKQAEQIAALSADVGATKAEVSARQQENAALLKRISGEKKDVLTNTTVTMNPQFSAALDRIDKLQSERSELLQEFTPESREVKDIEDRIGKEEGRLRKITATVVGSKVSARNPIRDTLLTQYSAGVAALAAANARLHSLQGQAKASEHMATNLPERERQLAEHLQQVNTLQKTYEMLSTRYHTLLISEQSALPSGMMSSTPQIPESATYPKTASNAALFLLLGAFIALAATLIAEKLDVRVHDPSMVEQMSGATALSMVPDMPRESPSLSQGGAEKPILLESFRILRNNIAFAGLTNGKKVLAITSPGRGEGKSTTSVNLAVTMAMDGNRVLLVDGDLRHPSLHKLLGIPGDVGLSNLLRGRKSLEHVIKTTPIENVDCIPAGPMLMNVAELLRSEETSDLFKDLRERYDAVLIDCPPAAGLSDAQVISTLADGILLVVSMSRTLRSHLDTAIRMLSYTQVPLVGLVINRVDANPKSYGYYYSNLPDDKAA